MVQSNEEVFVFLDENETSTEITHAPQPVWHILLVDDEPDVHAVTKLALRDTPVHGRQVVFSHAYSAAQARELLSKPNEFAVAVVDVVMETGDAGLQLIRYVREQLGNTSLRVILRTGQPGYAPEIETIERYDINDYKTKSELTLVRLFTSLTIAVRSYAQIKQLEVGRNGLEQILAAAAELGKPSGLNKFARGVVTQLCALLNVNAECLVCAAMHEPDKPPHILAAAGRYGAWIGMPLEHIPDARVKNNLLHTLHTKQHFFDDGASLFFRGANEQALAAFVDVSEPLQDIERGLLEVFCSNISVAFENLQLYLTIKNLAYNDVLVNLPNRNALVAAIDARVLDQNAVALLDLDNFADINNILDNNFGDTVLQVVAQRLYAKFAPSVLVARLGGDLFGLYGYSEDITPKDIAEVFAKPFVINNGEQLRLSATAGLVLLNEKNQSGVSILKNAGAALKQAKRFQRGHALYFEAAQAEAARDRMHMLNRLRASFSEEHLFLHYQPFVHLESKRVVGAECLLRWKTLEGQFIPPDKFIPIAEQSGLMIPMGEWVIRTAIKWRFGLQGLVDDDFRVAINVSHVQFAEPDFVEKLITTLNEIGVPGPQVEIELTESVAIENMESLIEKLSALHAHGIKLAMDDFGTGYSSLSVIQRLRLDRLKIDRSFVSSGDNAFGSFEIASTIIALAGHLQLFTIAEGIETQAQCDKLLEAGCEEGQGYLFSRPLPEADFVKWLDNYQNI